MEDHKPYKEILKREADFRVRYRFYSQEEGGRSMLPVQGHRSDFYYYHEEHKKETSFMIWPEFEDENGQLIISREFRVSKEGTARMWIINDKRIEYHRGKITVGMTCYFMEGKKTGVCEVIELINIK